MENDVHERRKKCMTSIPKSARSIMDSFKLNWIVLTPSAVNQIAIHGHAPLQKWKLRELFQLAY